MGANLMQAFLGGLLTGLMLNYFQIQTFLKIFPTKVLSDKTIINYSEASLKNVEHYLLDKREKDESSALSNKTLTFKKFSDADSNSDFITLMENLQKERKLTLMNACDRLFGMSQCKRSDGFVDNRNLFSSTYNYSVCYIQKCGSSNWFYGVMLMDNLETWASMESMTPDTRIAKTQRLRSFRVFSNIIEKKQKWNEYAKVILVRNPFDRIVSAFNAKLVPGSSGFSKIFETKSKQINRIYKSMRLNKMTRTTLNDATASFEDFVNHLLHSKGKDPHWEFYSSACPVCRVEYDFIMKLETFDQDMKYFQLKQNIPNNLMKTFYRNNRKPTNDVKTKKNFDTISFDMADKLYEMYKLDFELFGYSRPSWLCRKNY